MIEVKNLHVTFSPNTAMETQALCGADLKVEEGEFVTVIGSNGAGKSTLLAAIAGDIRPQEGRIFIDGKDVTGLSAHKRAGDIARVFQDPLAGTCASISVEENMSLAADRGTGRGWQLAYRRKNVVCFVSEFALWNWGWKTVWVILSGDYQAGSDRRLV